MAVEHFTIIGETYLAAGTSINCTLWGFSPGSYNSFDAQSLRMFPVNDGYAGQEAVGLQSSLVSYCGSEGEVSIDGNLTYFAVIQNSGNADCDFQIVCLTVT